MAGTEVNELAKRILEGDRRALSRAVTLVESTRSDHQNDAHALLKLLREQKRLAKRIGLSGTPGVGKSTFIEVFGMMLAQRGLKVAVLAVDPSSSRTGGSILGDKTRMPLLSREKSAFIRPSPSQATLGGVASQTRNVIDLCEGAGFDVILVETVGVGQSETMVADMTDVFLLLLAPAGGDELQGVKRGVMERADLVVVNKADGDLKSQATRTASDYAAALRLMRQSETNPEGYPRAMTVSALEENGLDEVWTAIIELLDWRKSTGIQAKMRNEQSRRRFHAAVSDNLLSRLHEDSKLRARWNRLEADVLSGKLLPDDAARTLLDELFT